MKDYGTQIPCPECGTKHQISARQLQAELQIVFNCARCGHPVAYDNLVAIKIHEEMSAIRGGLEKIKI